MTPWCCTGMNLKRVTILIGKILQNLCDCNESEVAQDIMIHSLFVMETVPDIGMVPYINRCVKHLSDNVWYVFIFLFMLQPNRANFHKISNVSGKKYILVDIEHASSNSYRFHPINIAVHEIALKVEIL